MPYGGTDRLWLPDPAPVCSRQPVLRLRSPRGSIPPSVRQLLTEQPWPRSFAQCDDRLTSAISATACHSQARAQRRSPASVCTAGLSRQQEAHDHPVWQSAGGLAGSARQSGACHAHTNTAGRDTAASSNGATPTAVAEPPAISARGVCVSYALPGGGTKQVRRCLCRLINQER